MFVPLRLAFAKSRGDDASHPSGPLLLGPPSIAASRVRRFRPETPIHCTGFFEVPRGGPGTGVAARCTPTGRLGTLDAMCNLSSNTRDQRRRPGQRIGPWWTTLEACAGEHLPGQDGAAGTLRAGRRRAGALDEAGQKDDEGRSYRGMTQNSQVCDACSSFEGDRNDVGRKA